MSRTRTYRPRGNKVMAVLWDGSPEARDAIQNLLGNSAWFVGGQTLQVDGTFVSQGEMVVREYGTSNIWWTDPATFRAEFEEIV